MCSFFYFYFGLSFKGTEKSSYFSTKFHGKKILKPCALEAAGDCCFLYKGFWSCVLFFYSLFFSKRLHICCFAFMSCLFVSLVIFFFPFCRIFPRALLRTFGGHGRDGEKKGVRFGIMELDSWERCCMGFPTCFFFFFSLVHCIFGLLGCYPGG